MVTPFPKDKKCPQCRKDLPDYDKTKPKKRAKEFEIKKDTVADKINGVQKKEKDDNISPYDEKIFLKGREEYIRFCGITSKERTPLYYTHKNLEYLLELTNNLDFIATSILDGTLDKMLLIRDGDIEEKGQFYEKNNIIYIIYGVFPDKKGKWILEQMAKFYGELIGNKDVDDLEPIEKREIDMKFEGALHYIFKEYLQLREVLTDHEIPYVDNSIRIDYIGLSSKSIGIISLLLDDQNALKVELPETFENPAQALEMQESALTAKIEAIAANTLGNTGAYPKWIAVKLKFQQYRFLTFKKYHNEYYLSLLSEGNLKLIESVEKELTPLLYRVINKQFTNDLRPYNQLKSTLKNSFEKEAMCPFCKHFIKIPFPSDHLCPTCQKYIAKFERRKFY